jgi:hypothetical protein
MGRSRSVKKPQKTHEHPHEEVEGLCELVDDHSGWPPHPSERRDLYHRIRCFPTEVVSWRKRLMHHVEANADIFPTAAQSGEQLPALVDEGTSLTVPAGATLCCDDGPMFLVPRTKHLQ